MTGTSMCAPMCAIASTASAPGSIASGFLSTQVQRAEREARGETAPAELQPQRSTLGELSTRARGRSRPGPAARPARGGLRAPASQPAAPPQPSSGSLEVFVDEEFGEPCCPAAPSLVIVAQQRGPCPRRQQFGLSLGGALVFPHSVMQHHGSAPAALNVVARNMQGAQIVGRHTGRPSQLAPMCCPVSMPRESHLCLSAIQEPGSHCVAKKHP